MKIVVVIPAYNEAATIRELAQRVLKVAETIPLQLVVVDDGSKDNTSECVADLSLTLFRNQPNQGKAASLWRAMQWAIEEQADCVISLDGDTQHRPEDIPRFVAAANAHPNTIIIGSRLHDKDKIPVSRYRANRFANFWVAWASGYPIEDSQTGFRLYPVSFLKTLNLDTSKEKGFVFESEILIQAGWQGIKTFPVAIPAIYTKGLRESHFKGVEDITKITRMISKRIISRGFYPAGLYRSSIKPMLAKHSLRGIDADAIWMLLLSIFIGVITLGLSHLWVLIRIIITARKAPSQYSDVDAVSVLGHALNSGEVSSDYALRLQRAYQLLMEHPQAKVLIIGGRPQGGLSEAEAGAKYLHKMGISADWISREEDSINTLDNLRNAIPWLEQYSAPVMISNRYHLRRVQILAANVGLDIPLIAAEAGCHWLKDFAKLLVEMIYIHWYQSGRYFARLTRNQRMLDKSG